MENILLNLIDDVLGLEDEEKETWKVEDDLTADWCLDKIRESKVRYNRFEMVVNDKIQQLQYALNEERKKIENEVGFFESKLREYFNTVENLAKETKTQKSYKLPGGQLKIRKATTVFDYDKDKLLEYAKENKMNDYIKTSEDFKWGDFKRQLEIKEDVILNKETGEIVEIEGLKLTEKLEEFKVEV